MGTLVYLKEYGEIWSEFLKFKEITTDFLNEIRDYFKTANYLWNKPDCREKDLYILHINKDNWWTKEIDGFWINVGIFLENNQIQCLTEIQMGKKFYQYMIYEIGYNLENLSDKVALARFSEEEDYGDGRVYGRFMPLSDLTDNYKFTKEKQLKSIISWMNTCIGDFINSGFCSYLENSYARYSNRNSTTNIL